MGRRSEVQEVKSMFRPDGLELDQVTVRLDLSGLRFRFQRPVEIRVEHSGTASAAMTWPECHYIEIPEVDGCLWEFMQLYQASEEEIIGFVRRWGIWGVWARQS